MTDRNPGIPHAVQDLTFTFTYNDIESVIGALDDDTACVILEPVVFEPPKDDFLHELRASARERGVVLVFDEMWTGSGCARGARSSTSVWGRTWRLLKAVANGMPLAVLTGRADVMTLLDKDVFFFTTFGGEALSLAAAKATIDEMRKEPVHARLFSTGEKLRDGYNAIAREVGADYTPCVGIDCRTMVTFDAAERGERARGEVARAAGADQAGDALGRVPQRELLAHRRGRRATLDAYRRAPHRQRRGRRARAPRRAPRRVPRAGVPQDDQFQHEAEASGDREQISSRSKGAWRS